MAMYNLRRFANAGGIKGITRENPLALLDPYQSYLETRGLKLPPLSAANGLNYQQIVNVLMNPNSDTPKALLDALYLVHEMATPEAMDVLIAEAENKGIPLDWNVFTTAADWLFRFI